MQNTLQKIISYTVQIADPDKIILFGSMSNGKANEYSDVDLLILSDNAGMKKETIAKIRSFSRELSLKVDVLYYSNAEIEAAARFPNAFLTIILKSGKVVYENQRLTTIIR